MADGGWTVVGKDKGLRNSQPRNNTNSSNNGGGDGGGGGNSNGNSSSSGSGNGNSSNNGGSNNSGSNSAPGRPTKALSPKEQYGHRYKTEHALMRRKIFVGGIGPLGEREITNFFSKQGEVESVEVLRGRDKQPRGFSFVIFKRAETVQKLVAARFFEIGNRPVEVKACEPQTHAGPAQTQPSPNARQTTTDTTPPRNGQRTNPAKQGAAGGRPMSKRQPVPQRQRQPQPRPQPLVQLQRDASLQQPEAPLFAAPALGSTFDVGTAPGSLLTSTTTPADAFAAQVPRQAAAVSAPASAVGGNVDQWSARKPFDADVEAQANSYLQRVYSEHDTIPGLVQKMQALRQSSDAREVKVFECIVHNLLDEYKFFPKYPEKELRITGILFGNLIQNLLLPTAESMDMALGYLCEALQKPSEDKMFAFGLCALEQARWRIHEFPQYSSFILQLPAVAKASPDSIATIQGAQLGQEWTEDGQEWPKDNVFSQFSPAPAPTPTPAPAAWGPTSTSTGGNFWPAGGGSGQGAWQQF